MKTALFFLSLFLLLQPVTTQPAQAQDDDEWKSFKGPLIAKIDWEDKPVSEAAAELVDLVVKEDKDSPWRNVRIRRNPAQDLRVTMHLRNVPAGIAFQNIALASVGKMVLKNGMVELAYPDSASYELRNIWRELRVITVSPLAVSRLGLTAQSAKQTLEKFGIKFTVDGAQVLYSEKSRELFLKAAPEECDLAAALILLMERTEIGVKTK